MLADENKDLPSCEEKRTMTGLETAISADAFRDFEIAGWEARADGYHRFFEPITGRVIEPLLDAAWVGSGTRTLDVATGPGYVAARAAVRGASVVGVDIAEHMVALAASLHPTIEFRQADAESLPFAHGSFDAVVANFLMPHLGRPEQVVAELARVLAPGGRLALTVWDAPEQTRLIGVLLDALELAGATPPPALPPGPSFFRFSAEDEIAGLLRHAGLEGIEVQTVSFTHRLSGPDELWEGLLTGTIRTAPLVLWQSEETRARIKRAFDRLVDQYAVDGGVELPVSVKLASGRRSS
jgi:SAM-dependent methyltransferase